MTWCKNNVTYILIICIFLYFLENITTYGIFVTLFMVLDKIQKIKYSLLFATLQ